VSQESLPEEETPREPTEDMTTVGAGTVVALGCTLVTLLVIVVGILIALLTN
jgi:hypothetical protein